jgi:hypothetical protein
MDGAFQPELRERVRLSLAWAEAGTPKQALRLGNAKRPLMDGDPSQQQTPVP